jgi:hypothetical protein
LGLVVHLTATIIGSFESIVRAKVSISAKETSIAIQQPFLFVRTADFSVATTRKAKIVIPTVQAVRVVLVSGAAGNV